MIEWHETGLYIAYPTTSVLKVTYPGHRTQVNQQHTKIGMAKRSFQARRLEYNRTFTGEVQFIPLAVVNRNCLSAIEAHVLAALQANYKTVGFAKEWFDTDDRHSLVSQLSSLASTHQEIKLDLEYFFKLHPLIESNGALLMSPQEAQSILEALANGADPDTGQPLGKESALHNPRTIRALFLAAKTLHEASLRRESKNSLNAGKPWTNAEDLQLLTEYDGRMGVVAIANLHARTEGAIASRLAKLGRLES